MKQTLMNCIRWSAKTLARLTLWHFAPTIIAVTGSVGKTSTKEAIGTVLGKQFDIRITAKSYNNELGVSFTIISSRRELVSGLRWIGILCGGLWQFLFSRSYPDMLILEYGVDKPGDMKELLEIARPSVGVVTAVGDIPVHVEFYAGPKAVAREKGRIVEALPASGFALLNYDDQTVLDFEERTRARIMTFGFGEGADMRISYFETLSEEAGRPVGIAFKLAHGGAVVPIRLEGVFGRAHAYAAAAAACTGIALGMNLATIAEALTEYIPPAGRMTLLEGIKQTYVIDDSYNASPLSMEAALETLQGLKGKRKVAVLGDMLEIGKYTIDAHEAIGGKVAKIADVLITIGPRAKFIAEAALEEGMPRRNIKNYDTAELAKMAVQGLVKKGDIVLIKGSRAMRLERVVEEVKAF